MPPKVRNLYCLILLLCSLLTFSVGLIMPLNPGAGESLLWYNILLFWLAPIGLVMIAWFVTHHIALKLIVATVGIFILMFGSYLIGKHLFG